MKFVFISFVGAALALFPAAQAHHSRANFASEAITVSGEVIRVRWANPHVYFDVAGINSRGDAITWTIETHAVPALTRRGWSRNSVQVGDQIDVSGKPDRNPDRRVMFGDWVRKADGSYLAINGDVPEAAPAAPSVESEIADIGAISGIYKGAFDPRAPAYLRSGGHGGAPLNDTGAAIAASFDTERFMAEAGCAPSVVPGTYRSPYLVEIQIREKELYIRHEDYDVRRIIPFADTLPEDAKPSWAGTSVARWDGDELVVKTAFFRVNPRGIGGGVPSGAGKTTVERFSVAEDGRSLHVEITMDDPEYLTAPFESSFNLKAVAGPLVDSECDVESATRFSR